MRRVVEELRSPIKKAKVVLPFCRTTSDIYFHAYRFESADLKYAQTTKSVIPRAKPVEISSTAVRPRSQPITL